MPQDSAPTSTAAPTIPAPTCDPPVNTAQPIAGRVVFYQGQPMLASKAPGVTESYDPKEVITLVYDEGKAICLDPERLGHQLPQHLTRLGGTVCMVVGARWDAPKIDRPNNADSAGAAGAAVLDAYRNVPKATVMDIDADRLEARLARLAYLQACRKPALDLVQVFNNNIAEEEGAISAEVRKGLQDVSGLLDDRRMEEALAPAILHVRGPAEQAVITRAMLKKAFEAGRAQGQAEAKAAAPPPPPPTLSGR